MVPGNLTIRNSFVSNYLIKKLGFYKYLPEKLNETDLIEIIVNEKSKNIKFNSEKGKKLHRSKLRGSLKSEIKMKLRAEDERLKMLEEAMIGKPIERKREYIVGLRSKKRRHFDCSFQTMKYGILSFDIFPKGEAAIKNVIRNLQQNGVRVTSEDETRLYKIAEVFPGYQTICIGKADFKGFVVFRFEDSDVVIAEKPSYGNATYLIKGDWEKDIIKILQFNRADARSIYSNQVKRVIHYDETQWIRELKFEVKWL